MAILNSIRKRGIFLILIIAMALFAFILSDVLTKGSGSQKGQDTVATVNGIDISRQEFMKQVETTQRSLGPNAAASQAMNIVWDRELRRTLIEEQYNELGLTAETNQIKNALRTSLANNPTFQNEAGLFDEGKLQEYIATIQSSSPQAYQQWQDFMKSTKQGILENTYLNMVKGGLISTIAEGEQEYRFENDKINIDYVHIPYSKIADEDAPVTDAEIEKYIRAHATEFEVESQVDIQYVSFSEEASQEDIDQARTDILALLNDNAVYNNATQVTDTVLGFTKTTDYATFVNANSDVAYTDKWWFKNELPAAIADTMFALSKGSIHGPYTADDKLNLSKLINARQLPDSVKVRHILIPTGLNPTDSITRNDAQAKTTADSILRIVKSNKSKFPELVKTMSSDVGSVAKEGRYDWFTYNTMVAEFRDFSFENKTGAMGIAKTQFGYHIIEIEGQKNPQKVVKVATITKDIEASEKTINDVFATATTFEVATQKEDFNELATAQNIDTKPVNKIGELDATIPGVGNNRSIITWAFNEDTNVGDVKRFNIQNGYVIAQLTRKNPKGLMSIAEASATVTPILRNEKKAALIRATVSGTTLQEVATSQNVKVLKANALTLASPMLPAAGAEPKVVGAAHGKAAGELTDLIDGVAGVYKVGVLEVNKAPALDNYARYANQLNQKVVQGINQSVFEALKSAAEIEDNRAAFY